jgi:uncharacterized protein YigE (DUF2233 family)
MSTANTLFARWTYDDSPSNCSGKNRTGNLTNISPRCRGRLVTVRGASFSRQMGGMYHPDNSPVGLYIEEGRELVRANTNAGPGNFHMTPNGVFYLTGEVAGILETRSFIKQKPQVDFATQSGPMLVIDGEVNARFVRYGGSRKYRVGVGNRDRNSVVFAISESEVSFGEFARLFRDRLRCKNALFLDGGSATSFYSAVLRRNSGFLPLGPIIGVYGSD